MHTVTQPGRSHQRNFVRCHTTVRPILLFAGSCAGGLGGGGLDGSEDGLCDLCITSQHLLPIDVLAVFFSGRTCVDRLRCFRFHRIRHLDNRLSHRHCRLRCPVIGLCG